MRLLIAEEALVGRGGHWFEYIRTIAKEVRKSGDTVKIAANRNASKDILSELEADPVFPESAWGKTRENHSTIGRLRQLWHHNQRLYHAADQYVGKHGSFDVLFVPTILIDHMLGWRRFAKRHAGKRVKKIVLFFVNGQGTYQGPGKSIHFDKSPNKLLFKQALRSLKKEIREGSVFLGCETREMAKEYEQFCGLPFEYLPHPVDEAPMAIEKTPGQALTLAHLGFSRFEKGSDLLQQAIHKYLKTHPDANVRFILQWVNDFALEDGRMCVKHPKLVGNPRVEYLTGTVNSGEYTQLLAKTDIMLLPYRLQSYYARVSRVAIEAAINSIPMIYTRDSWNESLVEDGLGAGEGFESEDVESLFEAIRKAVGSYEELKQTAKLRQPSALAHYSASNFKKILKFMIENKTDLLSGVKNRNNG